MTQPSFNRRQSNVKDWLDSHHEYMAADQDVIDEKGNKFYVPRNLAAANITPEPSDDGSSRSKGHRPYESSRHHRTRPITPPSEGEVEDERKDRDHDRDRRRSHQTSSRASSGSRPHDVEREDRRPRHDKETHYPPRAGRGRPHRPPMNTASTTPDFREDGSDTRHRRYSVSHSPPRHRDQDRSSRSHHHRRRDDGASSPTRHHHHHHHRDRDADRERRHRDRDGSGSTTSTTTNTSTKDPTKKPRRPPLSRSQTAPGAGAKSRRGSFSFLSDPRFTAAATAALQAGATAAVGAVGTPGASIQVARAALGAAALGALRSPKPAEAEEEAAPSSSSSRRDPAEATGAYLADHVGRRGSKRSKRREGREG